MDRFSSLEAFVAAVEAGSLAAAAERLGVAKSVVSKRVTGLERHLGMHLLNRSSRGLAVTASGTQYYEEVRHIVARLAEADARAWAGDAEPQGLLRVAAPMSFGTMQLKRVVHDLMARWPDLLVDLDMDDRVVDLEKEGHDLAVRIGRLDDSSLIARPIAPNRQLLCASPAYLERRGIPRAPEELRDHDGLLYTYREPHGMLRLCADGEPRSYRIRVKMRCNNGEMLLDATLAGLGMAILPTFMAASYLNDGTLVPVLPRHQTSGGALNAVYVRGRSTPAKVRVFIDALIGEYAPVAAWDRGLEV